MLNVQWIRRKWCYNFSNSRNETVVQHVIRARKYTVWYNQVFLSLVQPPLDKIQNRLHPLLFLSDWHNSPLDGMYTTKFGTTELVGTVVQQCTTTSRISVWHKIVLHCIRWSLPMLQHSLVFPSWWFHTVWYMVKQSNSVTQHPPEVWVRKVAPGG